MNLPALSVFLLAIISMCMKIYMHYKLIEPDKRNFMALTKYFGINFFLPLNRHYNSRRMESRKLTANRLLAFFYSCAILAVVFVLSDNP